MVPEDRLFATVDVTCHAGYLPNHMMVLYMDTVGFITDLPHRLKDVFSSTLEDVKTAVRYCCTIHLGNTRKPLHLIELYYHN